MNRVVLWLIAGGLVAGAAPAATGADPPKPTAPARSADAAALATRIDGQFLAAGVDAWLRQRFAANVPYDVMVRELLTVPVDRQAAEQIFSRDGIGKPTPLAFYMAKEVKPENLASATSRVFLGFRLECA